jgi:hypothetical protein
MLDLPSIAGFLSQNVSRILILHHGTPQQRKQRMADAGGDAEAAADRLEAALERIAALAARSATTPPEAPAAMPEVAERLDALIANLRDALDGPPS